MNTHTHTHTSLVTIHTHSHILGHHTSQRSCRSCISPTPPLGRSESKRIQDTNIINITDSESVRIRHRLGEGKRVDSFKTVQFIEILFCKLLFLMCVKRCKSLARSSFQWGITHWWHLRRLNAKGLQHGSVS